MGVTTVTPSEESMQQRDAVIFAAHIGDAIAQERPLETDLDALLDASPESDDDEESVGATKDEDRPERQDQVEDMQDEQALETYDRPHGNDDEHDQDVAEDEVTPGRQEEQLGDTESEQRWSEEEPDLSERRERRRSEEEPKAATKVARIQSSFRETAHRTCWRRQRLQGRRRS